jgi:hypothetical protein
LIDQTQAPSSPTLELAQALMGVQAGATILDFAWPDPAEPSAMALNRMLARFGPELAGSRPVATQAQTGADDVVLMVRRARNGATYLFFSNRSASGAHRGRAALWLDHDGVEVGLDYELPPLTAKVKRFPPNSTDPAEAEWLLPRK